MNMQERYQLILKNLKWEHTDDRHEAFVLVLNRTVSDHLLRNAQFIDWLFGKCKALRACQTRAGSKSYALQVCADYIFKFEQMPFIISIKYETCNDDVTVRLRHKDVDVDTAATMFASEHWRGIQMILKDNRKLLQ